MRNVIVALESQRPTVLSCKKKLLIEEGRSGVHGSYHTYGAGTLSVGFSAEGKVSLNSIYGYLDFHEFRSDGWHQVMQLFNFRWVGMSPGVFGPGVLFHSAQVPLGTSMQLVWRIERVFDTE